MIGNFKSKDITKVVGDSESKIGSGSKGYNEAMKTQGPGDMNGNGQWYPQFCALNELVAGGISPLKSNLEIPILCDRKLD